MAWQRLAERRLKLEDLRTVALLRLAQAEHKEFEKARRKMEDEAQ